MTIARSPERGKAAAVAPWQEFHRRHVLDLDDFSSEEIEQVLTTAGAMSEVLGRRIRKVPTLRGRTIVTLFLEPSTRTRASFEQAGKVLSADVINLSGSESSVKKGESLVDTAKTLEALGADVLVMRHPMSGAPNLVARATGLRVVNAGDGWHAHPTQALLDLFTIRQRLGRVDRLTVLIVGDILHSRVARSNIWGLTKLGARVVLCGPPTLMPSQALAAFAAAGQRLSIEPDLEHAIPQADVIMTLRLQKERMDSGFLPSMREYAALYQINDQRLARAKPAALVMHPGPMNAGVEISHEVAHGPRSLVETQVTNGVAVRMAILYLLAATGEDA
ncbi:MAG: aspartate carbamoyltransferase catalytic subunit [Dehalococcoidia bacterium]|nr:aspartate carbamoyltransferase catalytic subunit [Dehalococcoidia bacterium]